MCDKVDRLWFSKELPVEGNLENLSIVSKIKLLEIIGDVELQGETEGEESLESV